LLPVRVSHAARRRAAAPPAPALAPSLTKHESQSK
jgi:hypothetical protein